MMSLVAKSNLLNFNGMLFLFFYHTDVLYIVFYRGTHTHTYLCVLFFHSDGYVPLVCAFSCIHVFMCLQCLDVSRH